MNSNRNCCKARILHFRLLITLKENPHDYNLSSKSIQNNFASIVSWDFWPYSRGGEHLGLVVSHKGHKALSTQYNNYAMQHILIVICHTSLRVGSIGPRVAVLARPQGGREKLNISTCCPTLGSAIIDGQHIHIALIGQRALQAVVSQFLATSVHFFVC